MAKREYSIELCRSLIRRVRSSNLVLRYRPERYEQGDVLELNFTTVWPETKGRARLRIEKFVGGGFAGQVYRCILEHLQVAKGSADPGIKVGETYAIKIMLPPVRHSRRFRDALYWLAFQGPFSAHVNRAACRSGLLWQKLAQTGAGLALGAENAVADVYASFYDPLLQAHGEIREWVEGRTWRLESDTRPRARRQWATADPAQTDSPEYVAKRRFMHRFVRLLHEMGAVELARQYEWWTMKSQPNVLKRSECGPDPDAGLCAVDFRAGLALLPFLPMSPSDLRLICKGILRGSLVQFDRCDFRKLRAFASRHDAAFRPLIPMIDALEKYDHTYRESVPDITHQGGRLLVDPGLRRHVREGLTEGYLASNLVDGEFAQRLVERAGTFAAFYLLGFFPVVGRFCRRLWGNSAYRKHFRLQLTDLKYLQRSIRAGVAARLIEWHRAGRTSEERTWLLADHPGSFWLQRCTIGCLPAKLHRVLAEPGYVRERIREMVIFVRSFYRDQDFRERWLTDLIRTGYEDGMLDEAERDEILSHVRDPFIVKYLKSLAVHFATLPVTQIVSLLVGAGVAAGILLSGGSARAAGVYFAVILLTFQFIPISPGSLCRGFYVLYLIRREGNFRDYMVAAPLSFVKYLGYLAFPFQMVTTYPALARFMGGRWATNAVHVVPVFGEKGALLEHMVFDLFFNVPRILGLWAGRRVKGLLTVWMAIGLAILAVALGGCGLKPVSTGGVNLILAVVAVFVLPRVLFYPILKRRKS